MPRLRILPPCVLGRTEQECQPILEHLLERKGTIAIDTETTGLDMFREKILFWSMSTEDYRYFLTADMLTYFMPLFECPDITWALANAKYDMHQLKNYGIELVGDVHCIVVQDALEDDTREHGLKEQSKYFYGVRWGDFKELFLDIDKDSPYLRKESKEEKKEPPAPITIDTVRTLKTKITYRQFRHLSQGDKLLYLYEVDPDRVINYATCDAYFTLMLWTDHKATLSATPTASNIEGVENFNTLWDYFTVIEVPLTKTLWRMERRGITIDLDYLKSIDLPMRQGLAGLLNELKQLAKNPDINPDSPAHLRKLLFDKSCFKMKPIKYTKGGASEPVESTDEKVLDILEERYVNTDGGRFITKLKEYRQLKKLHGTYVRKMADPTSGLIGPDGRLHTQYNQAGARTARLSSSKPNVQQYPRVDNDPYGIRKALVAAQGKVLVDYDYPQIEFRVAAVLANERRMLESIMKGWDIHNANCATMYHLPYELIEEAQKQKKLGATLAKEHKDALKRRQEAKTSGLGALYGLGARKLAVQLGCSVDEAKEILRRFFRSFPDLDLHIKEMHQYAHDNGCTYTMLGRYRQLHSINSGVDRIESQEERQAYNSIVQGSSAELIKLAMLQIDHDELLQSLECYLLLSVHDELICECPAENAEAASARIMEIMSNPLYWGPIQTEFPVPIDPDGGVGHSWAETH